jgi:hypothetical protein
MMPTAICPFARNSRPGGRAAARDRTGSLTCPAGIHCQAPISACPVFSRSTPGAQWSRPLPSRRTRVVPLHARGGLALLHLASLIRWADRQALGALRTAARPHPGRAPANLRTRPAP